MPTYADNPMQEREDDDGTYEKISGEESKWVSAVYRSLPYVEDGFRFLPSENLP